jgi:hypothetical protein
MAGLGRKVKFHGAFGSKEKARQKEQSLGSGAFIKTMMVRGHRRYVVMTKRGG